MPKPLNTAKTAELAAKLRELERENAKLRKMCADLALRNDIIQTALEKGWGK